MKRIKKLLRKLKNNAGSSIIMVIVSIAFIGIVVGALLSAAVQSYRLKLVDMNSKENFYYVEQALNEIYTGVGSQTVEDLKNAYVYTVENMVQYDLGKGRYVTKTPEQTQKMFTDEFYRRLSKNDFFKDNNVDALATKLRSYITNDSVKLDDSRMVVEVIKDGGDDVGKIIRNVTLTRTAEYNRSSANGMYTQTITTDIVIGKPDFAVQFDAVNDQDPNIFKYALVADMGICVDQKTTPLTIAGNVYAASDYYNKSYNENTWNSDAETKKFTGTTTYEIENEDGTKSFVDVTQYTQREKAFFGANDANRINTAVNAIMASLEEGTDLYEVFSQFFEDQKKLFQAAEEAYINNQQNIIADWYELMKGQISKDAAANLQAQINAIDYMYIKDEMIYLPQTRASYLVDDEMISMGTTE